MPTQSTVQSARTPRRVVRRRAGPAPDLAWETALSDIPPELQPVVREYIETTRAAYEARLSLSSGLTAHGLRWPRSTASPASSASHCSTGRIPAGGRQASAPGHCVESASGRR